MESKLQAPQIPVFKKEEQKERKGGAFLWFWARAVQAMGPIGARIAVLTALGFLGGAVAGIATIFRPAFGPASASSEVRLAGVGSAGLHVRRPGNQSLEFAYNANRGQMAGDNGGASISNSQPAEQTQAGNQADSFNNNSEPTSTANNLNSLRDKFIRKMTSELGGSRAAAAGDTGQGKLKSMPGFMKPMDIGSSDRFGTQKFDASKATLKTYNRGSRKFSSASMKISGARAGKAMGQLMLARNMSAAGKSAVGDEAPRQFATDAFEQRGSKGGAIGDAPSFSNGMTIAPIGGGAPGGAAAGGTGNTGPAPSIDNPTNATPYQPLVDASRQQGSSGIALIIAGLALAVIGAVMVKIGLAEEASPWTAPAGWVMIALGLMMAMMAAMMQAQGQGKAQQAANYGDQISNQYGQKVQGENIKNCAQWAANTHNQVDQCDSSGARSQLQQQGTNGSGNASQTETNTGYQMDGGGGPVQ